MSSFVREQFPDIYKEEADFLIDFTKTYYDFVDTTMDRDIPKLRDIDSTLANFLIFFKKKYLLNLPLTDGNNDVADTRFIIKHIQDLYTRKGSEESLRLLFKLFYNTEIELYYPSIAIFKASDSVWEDKIYLEMFPINTMLDYPVSKGDKLTGSITGASGYVDEILFINYSGTLSPVAYLSNVLGKFSSDDSIVVTRTSNAGITTSTTVGKLIRGSITALSILPGARDGQKLGDILKVKSAKSGTGGTALVRELAEGNTSTIGFELDEGGWGYLGEYTEDSDINNADILPDIFSGNTAILSNQVIVLQQSLSPTIKVGDSLYSHGSVVSAINPEGTAIGTPAPNISGGGRVIKYEHPIVYINTRDQNQEEFLTYVYDQLVAAANANANANPAVNPEMKEVFNTEFVDERRLGVLRETIGDNGGYNSVTELFITDADALIFSQYKSYVLANNFPASFAFSLALIENRLLPAVFATGIGYKFDNDTAQIDAPLIDNGQANINVGGDAITTVAIGSFNDDASYEVAQLDNIEKKVTFVTDLVGDFIQTKLRNGNGDAIYVTALSPNKRYIVDKVEGTTAAQWHTAAGTQSGNSSAANYHADYVIGDEFRAAIAGVGTGEVIDIEKTNYKMSGDTSETWYTKFSDAFSPLTVTLGSISDIRVTQDVGSVYENAVFSEVVYPSVAKFNKTNAVLTINGSPNIKVGDTVIQKRTIEDPTLQGGSDIEYTVKGRCVGREDGTNNYRFMQLSFYDFIPTSIDDEELVHKGTRYTVDRVSRNTNSLAMGSNALINTTATALTDQITKVTPVKSGFRYDNDEEVDLLRSVQAGNFVVGLQYTITEIGNTAFAGIADKDPVITALIEISDILPVGTVFTAIGVGSGTGTADTVVARAKLTTLGQGQKGGSWQDATSFVSNNTKVLHDNYYYQEYSYDIASIIPSDKYTTLVDDIVGVAGTKMFSSPLINTSNDLVSAKVDVELNVWNIISEVYKTSTSAATYWTAQPADFAIITITNLAFVDPVIVDIVNIVDTDFSVICQPTENIKVGDIFKIENSLDSGDGQATINGYTTGKNYVVSSIDVTSDVGLTVPLVTGFTLVDTDGTTAVVTEPGTLNGLTFARVSLRVTCSATTMGLRDKVRITGTNTGAGSITGYTDGKKYVVSSIDAGTAPTVGSNYYTGVTAFTLVDSDGTTAVDTTLGTLSGLTFTRFTETNGVDIMTSLLPTGAITDLIITDSNFSITCAATDIAVGNTVKITGDHTGGTITGYTTGKNYVVSSIDAGTAPRITGFTLVDTDGTTPVVTTAHTPVGLVYKKFTASEELHATMITFNESKTI